MITFRTTTERSDGVDAWEVSVEAFYEMPEDLRYDETGKKLDADLEDQIRGAADGVRIAHLQGILVKRVLLSHGEEASELISDMSDLGSVFDIREGTYSTARNLLGWLEHGGDAKLFPHSDGPADDLINEIFVSEFLETDPHVDRGAILALMVAQLDQFSSCRLLCVHEEPVDELIPEDQRGRMTDRVRAISAVSKAMTLELIAANPGAEARGKDLRVTTDPLGGPVALPGQLPLFVIATPAEGISDLSLYVDDALEPFVIDAGDWCQARFGINLAPAPRGEPDPEPF